MVFQSHHWPRWGNAYVVEYMKKTRDTYKYIHDQSVRLLNEGYTSTEIAEMVQLPAELNQLWYVRGYYGTVKHDAKAVYQRYLGWYDANPANLDPLPVEPAAKKFVEYMGGSKAVLAKAREDFAAGNYRWVAQVVNNVVFAEPDNKEARELQADALEQLGYQSESGPWRSVYLQGAYELRNGVPKTGGINTATPDTIKAMPPEMLFDYLAVRLNGPKAAGKKIVLNLDFTDLKSQYVRHGRERRHELRPRPPGPQGGRDAHAHHGGAERGSAQGGDARPEDRLGRHQDRGPQGSTRRVHGPPRRLPVLVQRRDAVGVRRAAGRTRSARPG